MATEQYIYWKEEPDERTWKPIPDTQQARQQAIKQGAMFFTWVSLSEVYERNGQPEPHRWGNLPLDFDSKNTPEKALQDLRTLCLVHLPELFGIDPYAIEYYASGSKGFHAILPARFFDAQDGDPYLPLTYKRIAAEWKEKLSLETLDLSLYNMQRGKMFRIANVRRSNGRYKVPLTLEEVRDFSIDDLSKLTEARRKIDRVDVDLYESEELGNLYRTTRETLHKEMAERPEPVVELPKEEQKKLAKNLPPCISHILTAMPPKSETVNFNRLTMLLVNYFQMGGWDKQGVWTKVQPFIKNYPHSETYDTTEKRLSHWKTQWGYLQDNPAYTFNCSYVKGLGLPGSAFECADCIGKTDGVAEQLISLNQVQPQTLGELLATEFPEPAPIIENLLNEEEVTVFAGPKKLGKTVFSQNLAISVANGSNFLGYNVPAAQRVLYIQQEVAPRWFKGRIEKMIPALPSGPARENFFHVSRREILLTKPDTLKIVRNWIERVEPRLLVLDALYLFHNGKENSAKDRTNFFRPIFQMVQDYKVTVWLVHHHGKPSQLFAGYDDSDKSRGSSVIGGATDANIAMTRTSAKKYKLNEPMANYATLGFEFRNLEPKNEVVVYRNPETLFYEVVDVTVLRKVTRHDVVSYITDHRPVLRKDLIEALKTEYGAGERTVVDAIKEAVDEELIAKQRLRTKGNPVEYVLPEDTKNLFSSCNRS